MPSDPEPRYLLNDGSYHNIPTLQATATDRQFRLDPLPLSWVSLLVMNSLFAAFFFGAFAFVYSRRPTIGSFSILAVWLFTAIGYTAVVTLIHRISVSQGPAFVYCRKTGRIELPRHNLSFGPSDDYWFECLTARTEGHQYDDPCSELNFVCTIDGQTMRWNIMRSIATMNPFNGLEKEIRRETGIAVRRIAG